MLFDKLRQIEDRSEELARALTDPALYGQTSEYARLRKEHAETIEIGRASCRERVYDLV